MEGVLLDGEIFDEIALRANVGREVSKITKEAMEGKIDFEAALKKRLDLIKGFDGFEDAARNMPLMPYALELIAMLKDKGHYVAMITGSFDAAAKIIAEKLGIDIWAANNLGMENGCITGNFDLAFRDKADVLKDLKDNLMPDFTVAIGDGANDLNMLKEADVGIAFRAKQILKKENFLQCHDLRQIAQLFCHKGINIARDASVHLICHRLFGAIGNVQVMDLSKEIPRYANVIVIRTRTRVNEESLLGMPNLEIIATATTGIDHIDAELAELRNVKIVNAKGDNADAVAEYVFRTLLHATDDVVYTSELLKKTKDFANIKAANRRFELKGKTLGIIGLGNIGSRVKKIAEAFGMIVKAYDPYKEEARNTLIQALQCDFITLHPELTEETKGMIGKEEIPLIKEGAIVINAARAELIDGNTFINALKEGKIKKAIIDVFNNEPKASELYDLDNVICTPHIAGNSEEAKIKAAKTVFRKVLEEFAKKRQVEVIM